MPASLRGKRRMHKSPGQLEILACNHWLESEIGAVQPQAAVALGSTAARALMGRPVKVMTERGHWLQREDGLRVLITLHPSALLRGDPAQRAQAFEAWVADLDQATGALTARPKAAPKPRAKAERATSACSRSPAEA
jgi:DNA polymerase